MTILQYLSAFRLFGGDVLVLGLAVTIAVSVLKKTALKNAPKKLFVFLPFALGTIVFAAFRCLAELSAAPLTSDLAATFEGGFACGCAATLYYVVYEQFLRVKQSAAGNAENAAENVRLRRDGGRGGKGALGRIQGDDEGGVRRVRFGDHRTVCARAWRRSAFRGGDDGRKRLWRQDEGGVTFPHRALHFVLHFVTHLVHSVLHNVKAM